MPGVLEDVLSTYGHPFRNVTRWVVQRDVIFVLWLMDAAFLLGTRGREFGLLSDTSPLAGDSKLHIGCHQLSLMMLDGTA
eukprot:gene52802-37721_t